MRIVGIVQARMGSQRLPGKVLRMLGGRSVLGWVIRAARESNCLDGLVVATSDLPEDEAVTAECAALGVRSFRGSLDDVLSRFIGALDSVSIADSLSGGFPGLPVAPFDAVMRFTADCPLLDPAIIAATAASFRAEGDLDYLSTSNPRRLPRGLDVEIIRADTLRALDAVAVDHHRRHVTSYVYTHPEGFRISSISFTPDTSDLRITLDTPQDWELIDAVVRHFGDRLVPVRELSQWLYANPEVRALNGEIRQKALIEG